MASIFNRKPKRAKSDFDKNSLPQTRVAVFFDVLKLHWRKLLVMSLVTFLFCLPMHVVSILQDFNVLDINANFVGDQADVVSQRNSLLAMTEQTTALVKIPCFALLSVAIAGFSRIIKRFCWMQNVKLSREFFAGVKGNWGQMLLLGVLVGVVNLAVTYCYTTSAFLTNEILSTAMLVFVAFALLVLLPVGGYLVVCIAVYNNKFVHHLQVAFSLYARNPFKSLLATLCCVAPFVAQFLPFLIGHFVGRIVATLLVPLIFLGWFLHALNQLDEVVNKQLYPELVGKGTIWD